MARKQWRCFYCDQVFYSEKRAAFHFGTDGLTVAACQIPSAEGSLIEYIRKIEAENEDFRRESHATLVAAYAIQAEARGLARKAEGRGYDKGVSDGIDYARAELAG